MSFKWDWETKELVEGERPHVSSKAWGVVLVGLVAFGLWFTFGGYAVLFKLIMGVLGL